MTHRNWLAGVVSIAVLLTACAVGSLMGIGGGGESNVQIASDEESRRGALPASSARPNQSKLTRGAESAARKWAKKSQAAAEARKAWLAKPKQVRARARSRDKFRDVSPATAANVVSSYLPTIGERPAWQAPPLKSGERIVGYESPTQARIAKSPKSTASESESLLVESVGLPIAIPEPETGSFKPVDTELHYASDQKAWVPKNTAVRTALPRGPTDAISIGQTSPVDGMSVRLDVDDARAAASARQLTESKLFYAETQHDTDTVLEATPLGVSVSWSLRSPSSPDTQRLGLTLPPDAKVALVAGGDAEIVSSSGAVLGRVSAPVAFDAQGTPVKSRLKLDPDGLSVEVDHRGQDLAYPIGVDPVMNWYGNPTVRAENGSVSPNGEYWMTDYWYLWAPNSPRVTGAGDYTTSGMKRLYLTTGSGTSSGVAGWTYYPVRDASVVRADFANVRKLNSGIAMTIGMLNAGGGWMAGQWGGWYSNGVFGGGANSPFGNTFGYAMTANGTSVLICAEGGSACNWHGETNNAVMFSISTNSATTANQRAEFLGGYFYLSDNENPTMSALNGMPSASWRQGNSISISTTVSDAGLGIGSSMWGSALEVGLDDVYLSENKTGPVCDGGPAGDCPSSQYVSKTVSFTGERKVTVRARDIIGHSSAESNYTVRNDSSAPAIALSGRFGAFAFDSASQTAPPRTMVTDTPFVVTATDGSTTAPHLRQAGVRSISAILYDSDSSGNIRNAVSTIGEANTESDSNCNAWTNPSKNSCPLKLSGTFAASTLTPGIYYLRVIANDYSSRTRVVDYKVAVGIAELTSVSEGQSTARYLPLQVRQQRTPAGAALPQNSSGTARLQWRVGKNVAWNDVPLAATKVESTGLDLSASPFPLTDGLSQRLVVDLDALRLPGGAAQRVPDGEVSFRAVVSGSEVEATRSSEDVAIVYDRGGKDTDDERTDLGAGSVDLVSGNLSISESDVSIDAYKSPLTVTRTYNSRYSTSSSYGVFGPGWTAGAPAEESGSEYSSLMDNADVGLPDESRYPFVEITGGEDSVYSFELDEQTGKYKSEVGLESLRLERTADTAVPTKTLGFTLTDADEGTVTTFERPDPSAPPGAFAPVKVDEIGTPGSTKLSYSYSGGKAYLSSAIAASGNVSCSSTLSSLVAGCQALSFTYVDVSIQGTPAGKRLTTVTLHTYAPELASDGRYTCNAASICQIPVASYAYDSLGRLTEAWDPRITPALKTVYTYSSDTSAALITSTKQPGQNAFDVEYASLGAADTTAGRVKRISRLQPGGTTASWSVRYYVPTSGAGAPYDFSAGEVSKWGQDNPPFMAAAIFPPDQQPSSDPPPTAEYARASMAYLDPMGREVNGRQPGGRTTVTEYNKYGEATRSLGAENLKRAMALSTPSARLAAAEKWDTERTYEKVVGSLEGRRHLVRTVGPERTVKLDNGTTTPARTITQLCYDEKSPLVGDTPVCKNADGVAGSEGSARATDNPTEEPLDLVTTQRVSALVGSSPATSGFGEEVGRASGGTISDTRKTTTSYGTTSAEWKMRIPRTTVTDPDGLNIVHSKKLNDDGLVTEAYQPRSSGSAQPSTTKTTYYSDGTVSGSPECSNKPQWLGLACKVEPGAQPTNTGMPKLPVSTMTYNYLRQALVSNDSVQDANGTAHSRVTTNTYDVSGRLLTTEMTASSGEAIKKTRRVYDATSGLETEVQSLNSNGTVASKIVREFDELGRQKAYTDASGLRSTTAYDVLSRVVSTDDGKAARTFGYDALTGDLTQVQDAGTGTFLASYDDDGRVVWAGLPGSLNKYYTYDESGSLTAVLYQRTSGCTSVDCNVFENWSVDNIHSQMRENWTRTRPLGQDVQESAYEYDYDKSGRLKRTDDWRNDAGMWRCKVREYSFDQDSNRIGLKTIPENALSCNYSGAGTTKTSSYDDADRTIDSGYQYDAFGRIVTTPQVDAGGSSPLTATYYVNDQVRSITQDGTTQTFDMDPLLRTSTKSKTTGSTTTTETYRYTGDSDSPAWVSTGPSSWQRYVEGIAGVDMSQDESGSRHLFTNIRGDVVAEGYGRPVSLSSVDEFGVPKAPLAPGTRYAFHGAKQREALTPDGVVGMGVRLYVPRTGRFLQTDPVPGGSSNPYDFAYQDPVNVEDPKGDCPWCWVAGSLALKACQKFCPKLVKYAPRLGKRAGKRYKKIASKRLRANPIEKSGMKNKGRAYVMRGKKGEQMMREMRFMANLWGTKKPPSSGREVFDVFGDTYSFAMSSAKSGRVKTIYHTIRDADGNVIARDAYRLRLK